MAAPPVNDSSLDRNTIQYTIALREQWSGNSLKLLSSFCQASVAYFALTFVRQWTTAKIVWKLMPKTIVALRQKSEMKTVLKKSKAASQLKTVLKRKSIPSYPWSTLINHAASKVLDQYNDILQALLMEGHDESRAKEEAFAQILPVFQKELGDVFMDNLAWVKALKKDPIHKKIMSTGDD